MSETVNLCHTSKAESIWNGMQKSEQTMVRVGMFPHGQMMQAQKDGYDSKELAVALMKIASSKGGMRA